MKQQNWDFKTETINRDMLMLITTNEIKDEKFYQMLQEAKVSYFDYINQEKLEEFRSLDVSDKFNIVNVYLKKFMISKLKVLNIDEKVLEKCNFEELCNIMNKWTNNKENIWQICYYLLAILADIDGSILINIWLSDKYEGISFMPNCYEIKANNKIEAIDMLQFIINNLFNLDFIKSKRKKKIIVTK